MITSTSVVHKKNAKTRLSPDHSITLTTRMKMGRGNRINSRSMVTLDMTKEHGVAFDIPYALSIQKTS